MGIPISQQQKLLGPNNGDEAAGGDSTIEENRLGPRDGISDCPAKGLLGLNNGGEAAGGDSAIEESRLGPRWGFRMSFKADQY